MFKAWHRILSLITVIAVITAALAGCSDGGNIETVPPAASESDAPIVEEVILAPEQFIHAQGLDLVDENGDVFLMRAVNFVNDALCNPPRKFFPPDENYYAELNSMGINSIRFYLNYGLFENDDEPYAYKESGFDWVDQNLELAEKYNIRLYLSLIPQGCWKMLGWSQDIWKDESLQKRFVALSTAIAERYYNEPYILGYGLIGEPVIPIETSVKDSLSEWQKLAQKAVDGIRTVDKNHPVFVECVSGCTKDSWQKNGWDWSEKMPNNGFVTVKDSNIVYEFHDYEPSAFTFQSEDDNVTYPLPKYGKKQLKKELSSYADLRKQLNAPMLCGEFGCVNKCYEGKYNGLTWLDDFTDICEELRLNYAFFSFRDQWYDEDRLDETFWNEKVVDFFKTKYGALSVPPQNIEIKQDTDPSLVMPSTEYNFSEYMRASGINCVVMPCYIGEDCEFYYPNEPLFAWVGDNTWQIMFDLNDFGDAPLNKLGKIQLEVISYGKDLKNCDVGFTIKSVELKKPDSSVYLDEYAKDYSMYLGADPFGQNSNVVEISDFGEDIKTYNDLRQYRMVIKIEMTKYNSFFALD